MAAIGGFPNYAKMLIGKVVVLKITYFFFILFLESFSNWFEGKTDLPIFEDIPNDPTRNYSPIPPRFKAEDIKTVQPYIIPVPAQVQPVQDTTVLIQEFETVFDSVELTHNTLTPPQSPPSVDTSKPFITLQPAFPPVYYQPGTPLPDVAHELAVVDELVRTRAENLVDAWDDQAQSVTSPSSPSSNSSCGNSECLSDPEWIPEPVTSDYVARTPKERKRSKPYRIGPDDKKFRKKEQNKNAATRYRQKKKAEVEEILSEEKGLLDEHDKLDSQVTDLQREIKYLKGLMRDLFRAKGLLN